MPNTKTEPPLPARHVDAPGAVRLRPNTTAQAGAAGAAARRGDLGPVGDLFEAAFPGGGYGPGQVHTVRLLGRTVRIRVAAVTYTWSFGDGSPLLVTGSAGGPWPDGDVHHAYARPGYYTVQVTASYQGEYSVQDGPWLPIDAPVPSPSPPVTLTVATARNELLPDP